MEVTALCIRLMMTVLVLLAAQDDYSYSQRADAAFPTVVPNRQQFFEYESIAVSCEGLAGLTGWRVMKNVKGGVRTCSGQWTTSTGPCEIQNAIPEIDTGGYWCEIGGRKSNTVNITVTAGSVILESPVLPVMEGDNVTLSCRKKPSSSNLTAHFFKDGVLMDSSPTGNMTIDSISQSNEGVYKCSISEAGESAGSWLIVRAASEEGPPSPEQVPQLYLLLCIGVCVFLLVVSLLVGLLRCRKHQTVITGTTSPPSIQSGPSPQTVSEEDCTGVDMQTTYAAITKPKKKNESAKGCTGVPMQTTYATIEKGSGVSSGSMGPVSRAGY